MEYRIEPLSDSFSLQYRYPSLEKYDLCLKKDGYGQLKQVVTIDNLDELNQLVKDITDDYYDSNDESHKKPFGGIVLTFNNGYTLTILAQKEGLTHGTDSLF